MTFVIDAKTGKQHREFFAIDDDGWNEISEGIHAKVLAGSMDEHARKGHLNRIARWEPNARIDAVREHSYYEEVFVASGSLLVAAHEDSSHVDTFPAFSFACRPPGAKHGPFQAGPEGCVLFETVFFL